MKISILIVTLNSGEALIKTIDSCLKQNYHNYEIIVKDAGSTDNSIETLPIDGKIRVITEPDKGIYDAMNQAASYASGDFSIFMNSGDSFYNDDVIENISSFLRNCNSEEETIYYGDCYTENRDSILKYPEPFTDYVCFTMVLCHQATIYPTKLLKERPFNLNYRIAADYEYYVYAYTHEVKILHIPVVIARYQGDGASETVKNRKRALQERREICKKCFAGKRYWKTWLRTQIHGFGIKHLLVTQEWFYPTYKRLANLYYKRNS